MIRILVPSRGRPARAGDMIQSAIETAAGLDDVRIHLLVDDDDPELEAYQALADELVSIEAGPQVGYTGSLNRAAAALWDAPGVVILGAFGDDVLFRTPNWDDDVRAALATPGMAYANDLIHGANHPSAVFMRAELARALGWLALPATTHQWADDGWKRLGQATKCLRYMGDVVIEHMHPGVGKAEWDDTYRGVFDDARAKADYEGFQGWLESGGLDRDALIVREVLDEAGRVIPRVVMAMPELGWISIDDKVWFTGNVLTDGKPSTVLAVHINPATGEQCRRSPRTIGRHAIVSRSPLTIRGGEGASNSLACDEPGCSWHGYVTSGHWVPA